MAMPRITIIGAGLGGALLACQLGKAGYRVDLCERREDPRREGFIGGRSINLAISRRGLTALKRADLDEKVLKEAVQMPGRMIHAADGSVAYQPYSRVAGHAINSVSRSSLNLLLLEAAASYPNVELRFECRCVDVDIEATAVTFERGSERTPLRIDSDLIVGADGAYSVIRDTLRKNERFDYEQSFLTHGYKELEIPPVESGRFAPFAIEPKALHIWPRGSAMMIALPNKEGSFTCTCFWPFEGEHGFDQLRTDEQVLRHFQRHYGDVLESMPTLLDDFRNNPVGSMVTIRCRPWHVNRVTLLGDAAHAIVPFYGQGANAAFEDCGVLVDSLRNNKGDLDRALLEYEQQRIENAEAIADMAIENFIEMRDHTGRASFRAWKKVEKRLHAIMPTRFVPLYDMISFSNIPYADARRRWRNQLLTLRIVIGILCLLVLFLLFLFIGG